MARPTNAARIAGPLAAGSVVSLGAAPAIAMGMTYVAMAGSLGLAMQNACATQQRTQVLADAALAQVLALIIARGSK